MGAYGYEICNEVPVPLDGIRRKCRGLDVDGHPCQVFVRKMLPSLGSVIQLIAIDSLGVAKRIVMV